MSTVSSACSEHLLKIVVWGICAPYSNMYAKGAGFNLIDCQLFTCFILFIYIASVCLQHYVGACMVHIIIEVLKSHTQPVKKVWVDLFTIFKILSYLTLSRILRQNNDSS